MRAIHTAKPLFSNGTEMMLWQGRNCEQCTKAVWYNPKTDTYPKHRCAIQRNIELAAVNDGQGDERTYKATHSDVCPFRITDRETARKKKKVIEGQMKLFE